MYIVHPASPSYTLMAIRLRNLKSGLISELYISSLSKMNVLLNPLHTITTVAKQQG